MSAHISRRAMLRASCLSLGAAALPPALLSACETMPEAGPPLIGFPLIVDTATRLDAGTAAALRTHGVQTVFRYYCHLPPSLPEKDLTREEARIILSEGLSLAAVFQHYNNCFLTFENRWGREDAEQALRQAEAVGQPAGSAVYFGVDGDWPYRDMVDPVVAYFEDVARVFEGSGLDVGIYSNGCLCNAVVERGLASYAWLSGSTAHTGTQAFYNTGGWSLYQNALDIRIDGPGIAVDTNIANPARGGYFGQFGSRGARSAAHDDAQTRGVFAARRFVRANVELKAEPLSDAATAGRVRKDQNVRVTGAVGTWARVLTQEGGGRPNAPAVEGWVPQSALALLDSFPDGTTAYGLCGANGSLPETRKYESCAAAASRRR